MSNSNFRGVLMVAVLGSCLFSGAALAVKDVKGSADHPLVSRYDGATVTKYESKKYDEYTLVTGKVGGGGDGSPVALEGRITMVRYAIDRERATLEVFRNYKFALADAGFEIIFSCKNKDCGGFKFSRAVHGGSMRGSTKDKRYIAAKLVRPEGTAYVSLYIKKAYEVGGPTQNTVYATCTSSRRPRWRRTRSRPRPCVSGICTTRPDFQA